MHKDSFSPERVCPPAACQWDEAEWSVILCSHRNWRPPWAPPGWRAAHPGQLCPQWSQRLQSRVVDLREIYINIKENERQREREKDNLPLTNQNEDDEARKCPEGGTERVGKDFLPEGWLPWFARLLAATLQAEGVDPRVLHIVGPVLRLRRLMLMPLVLGIEHIQCTLPIVFCNGREASTDNEHAECKRTTCLHSDYNFINKPYLHLACASNCVCEQAQSMEQE